MSINRSRPTNFTRETIAIETKFYFCERKAFPIHDIWQVLSPWVFSASFVGALAAFILQVKGKCLSKLKDAQKRGTLVRLL
jgi:hypothetical protein